MKTCKKCGYEGTAFASNRLVCNPCRSLQRDMNKYAKYQKSEHRKHLKRKAMDKYREANKAYYAAMASEHRAKRKLRSVGWADQQYIKDLYANCKEAEEIFDVQFEVDHIVPLQNELVCGLHNEFNLQVLTRAENRAKYNKFEVA